MKQEYIILESTTASELAKRVTAWLQKDWKLHGGLVVTSHQVDGAPAPLYAQAMIFMP